MVPDAGNSAATSRASMQSYKFSYRVMVADLQPGFLAREFQVLGRQSDRGKGENLVVLSQPRGPLQDHVRHQFAFFAHLHFWADYTVRPYAARVRNFRLRINNRGGMYHRPWCR